MTASSGQEPLTYLALGDSYTMGEGVSDAERWPNQMVQLLRARGVRIADPVVIARTGWTTFELAAAIAQHRPPPSFDLVTLLIGVNDEFRGRACADYAADFAGLLSQSIVFAKGQPDHVIALSIPDWSVTPFAAGRDQQRIARGIDEYNAANRGLAEHAGANYVNITDLSRRAAPDRLAVAPDGLHPSGAAYAQWAERVARVASGRIK